MEDVPASFAMTSPEAMAWEDRYADQFPWVKAVRTYRRVNMLYQRVKTLKEDVRPDGTFPYGIKYFGAGATGRFSGGSDFAEGGKFNVQNMTKMEMFGVDLRSHFIAKPNRTLIMPDYCQVEARYLLWLVKDKDMLAMVKAYGNLYEAGAEKYLGMTNTKGLKDREPQTYHMLKAMILGGGYQMGWKRFIHQAPILTQGKYNPTENEAKQAIHLVRSKNPKIVQYWYARQKDIAMSAYNKDATYEIELASGRWLTYYGPESVVVKNPETHENWTQYRAVQVRGREKVFLYGGKVTENVVQASCRDVLRDGWIALEKAGHRVYFTSHDEFIIDGAIGDVEEQRDIQNVLSKSSPWASGCPLEVEFKVAKHYLK